VQSFRERPAVYPVGSPRPTRPRLPTASRSSLDRGPLYPAQPPTCPVARIAFGSQLTVRGQPRHFPVGRTVFPLDPTIGRRRSTMSIAVVRHPYQTVTRVEGGKRPPVRQSCGLTYLGRPPTPISSPSSRISPYRTWYCEAASQDRSRDEDCFRRYAAGELERLPAPLPGVPARSIFRPRRRARNPSACIRG
jgi:hypothetical protein